MKAVGTNTASSTRVVAMTGPVISCMALIAACFGDITTRNVPRRVFHDHDRIINHDADGQHDAEQRQHVQREPQPRHDGERTDQRDGYRDYRDNRGPPILQRI